MLLCPTHYESRGLFRNRGVQTGEFCKSMKAIGHGVAVTEQLVCRFPDTACFHIAAHAFFETGPLRVSAGHQGVIYVGE